MNNSLKRLFVTLCLIMLSIPGSIHAQNIVITRGLKTGIEINTAQIKGDQYPTISITFRHDTLSGNRRMDSLVTSPAPLRIMRKDGGESFPPIVNPQVNIMPRGFLLRFSVKSKSEIEWFYKNGTTLQVVAEDSLVFALTTGKRLVIRTDAFAEVGSRQKPSLSKKQKEELIDALGSYKSFYYDRFDAGWRDAESDSGSAEGYLDFAKAFDLGSGFLVELEGLLSTDIDDIASYLQVSPFYFRTDDNKFHFNAAYQSSLNGDEQRLMGRLSYRSIMKQNPVNLTHGFDRLRLKPYLNVGVTAMYFTDSADPLQKEEYFFEPFASVLYIIPIAEKYTARFDAFAYWRSDAGTFDFISENIDLQGTVQLGYGIGSSAQVIGKYSFGTFNLTNQTNNRLMVGFLMELLNK